MLGYAWKTLLVLSYLLLLLQTSDAKSGSGLILTYQNAQEVQRVYTDGKNTLYAFFKHSRQLLDCDVRLGKDSSLEIFEEALTMKSKDVLVEYDLRRLIRQCKRFLRKMLRKDENDPDPLVRETKKRLKLHLGYPGTNWCKTFGSPDNKTLSDSSKTRKADRCCKALHECPDVIPEATKIKELFNRYPWPIHSCQCQNKFRKCLRDAKRKAADEIGHIYFDFIKVRCFEPVNKQMCVKYDQWYTQCMAKEFLPVASLKQPADYLFKREIK
ncbi:uncharacterized protein LOC121391996 [Gigantopelta aegis]|uniref:uncharacterized protein LOC121391996 n=1 Tax=Gigantopelta aegis TaxID=1735272 RepID=UPI001B889B6B|nr:uncharacterized protein LOC121391996 [Gigantopelta aegis]